MYVGASMYEKYPKFVDLDDADFFRESLRLALETVSDENTKENTPVVFCSRLSSQTPEEITVERREVHSIKRSQRRFILIDADYEANETEDSERMQQKLKDFCAERETPLLIYPTMSYPDKPRFRAIIFTKGLLDEYRYEQAVRWLYHTLGEKLTDEMDLSVSHNSNLPMFNSSEQAGAVYSTLDDGDLKPIQDRPWVDHPMPRGRAKAKRDVTDEEYVQIDFDPVKLVKWSPVIGSGPLGRSYVTFWKVAQSVALEVVEGNINKALAEAMLDKMAEGGAAGDEAKAARWSIGNRELLNKHIESLQTSMEDRSQTRPLFTYTEFMNAIRK